jgi:hypothetical protein
MYAIPPAFFFSDRAAHPPRSVKQFADPTEKKHNAQRSDARHSKCCGNPHHGSGRSGQLRDLEFQTNREIRDEDNFRQQPSPKICQTSLAGERDDS